MNFENLTRSELIAARIQCDDSLLFFTRFWFRVLRGSKFIVNKHHIVICDALKEIENYEKELLNINIPPRFSKTELAAVNFIASGIGMNPASNWLYITASDELRAQTSVSIRDIVQHPYFKIMYGVELKKDQNGKNLWRTNKGGGLKTATIFGQITGFGAGQMIEHNNELNDYIRDFEGCIVLDDLNKIDDSGQENANNDKVSRVLLNTVLSRKNSKDTPIINIQQRAGASDATAIFKDFYADSDKARFLVMPAINENGEYLWEWKCGADEIERLKAKSINTFQTQYMQDPQPIEGLLLPISTLRFADIEHIKPEDALFKFAVGDPADTGGDKFSMPFVYAVMVEGKIKFYVKDVIHNTAGIAANNDRIIDKAKNLQIEQIFIESNGVGLASVVLLKRTISENVLVSPFPAKDNKEVRVHSNYEFIRDHFVFDSKYQNSKEYDLFIKDLTTYQKDGENKHKKDAIDVLSTAAKIMKIKYGKVIYG